MAAAPALFELRGVRHGFGDATLFGDLSLTLSAGTTTVLLGPSGSGKSTLMRMLLGLLLPAAGEVRFLGERLAPERLRALRLRIGYVVQGGGLFAHLTLAGNASLMARALGWSRPRIAARLEELAATVRLDPELLARYPAEVSGGQRQRAALMRALFLGPECLLLDEPLSALDPLVRFELQQELTAIIAGCGGAVWVTHDLVEAARIGGEVVLMDGGTIRQRGTLRELVEHPADPWVRRFVAAQTVELG